MSVVSVVPLADINECQDPSYCKNGRCVNTPGSFHCICTQPLTFSAALKQCVYDGGYNQSALSSPEPDQSVLSSPEFWLTCTPATPATLFNSSPFEPPFPNTDSMHRLSTPPLACFYRNTLSLVRDIMRLEMVNVISVLEVQCDPVAHFSVSVYVVAPLSLHSHRKTLHYFILHCVHVLVRLRHSERV